MTYTPTDWADDNSLIPWTTNLDNLEAGVVDVDDRLTTLEASTSGGGRVYATGYGVETGAVANITTNTTNMQTFITAIVTGGLWGELPAGEIRINSALQFPRRPGWTLSGAGRAATIIRQYTDDTPILQLGSDSADEMHSWAIQDLGLDYDNTQTTSETDADCIRFSQMGYEATIARINFYNGYRGIGLDTTGGTITSPWGIKHDELNFGSGIAKSAIDNATNFTTGAPNNVYGRILVDATSMDGPVFYLTGEAGKIDAVEILNANQGPKLLDIYDGSTFEIGTIKLESGTYAASEDLFSFRTNANVRAGHLRVTQITASSTAEVTVVRCIGGTSVAVPQVVTVGLVGVDATFNDTSKGYIARAAVDTSHLDIDHVIKTKNGGAGGTWELQDSGATDTATQLRVLKQNNGHLSTNQGDANLTVTQGGPNVLIFKTTFTASRTVTLPSNADECWNGLKYTVITQGAVNGANTLVVASNSVTLHTLSTDNYAYEYTYRRQNATDTSLNWQLTAKMNLA